MNTLIDRLIYKESERERYWLQGMGMDEGQLNAYRGQLPKPSERKVMTGIYLIKNIHFVSHTCNQCLSQSRLGAATRGWKVRH